MVRESWMDEALCAQTDPELWFPDKGAPNGKAKAICGQCPVVTQCLTYALKHGMTHGIWGGLSAAQRQEIMPDQARAVNVNLCINGHDRREGARSDGSCAQCRREQERAYKERQRTRVTV